MSDKKENLTEIVQVSMDIVKSSNPDSRLICGIVSTEDLDRQGEVIVQKGLNFDDFMQFGWFNDDHSKKQSDILGYPTKVEFVKSKGWYVEGELIKGHETADAIYKIAQSLHKSPRKLGFSIQGKVEKRHNNRILKARVSHVAITHQPVNPMCTMDVLVKSFCSHFEDSQCMHCIEDCEEEMLKSIAAGGVDTSEGGAAVRKESLDGEEHECCGKCSGKCKTKKAEKSFACEDEIAEFVMQQKGYSKETSLRIAKLIMSGRL